MCDGLLGPAVVNTQTRGGIVDEFSDEDVEIVAMEDDEEEKVAPKAKGKTKRKTLGDDTLSGVHSSAFLQ